MKKTISRTKCARAPIILLLIVVAVLSNSCETDKEPDRVISARQWFEKNFGTQWDAWPKVSEGLTIEWADAVVNGKSVEIPVRLQETLVGYIYDGNQAHKGQISLRLVLWPQKEGYEAVVFQFIQLGGNVPRHLGEIDQSGFSGMIQASYGASLKYAAMFEDGKQTSVKDEISSGRLKDTWCLYTIYEHTLPLGGGVTYTWITYELQYCFDPTSPQAPLPPEGGGWVLDYSGGGSGSGTEWSPDFPANPQDGALFEVFEPSGKSILKRYSSASGSWLTVRINLPSPVITPQEYPYLYYIPTSFVVQGPDDFVYYYDGGNGSWIGEPIVQNEIATPCLYYQVEAIRNASVDSDVEQIFSDVFNSDTETTMYQFTESANPGYTARTFLETTNPLHVRTDLNTSILSNASMEFTTIVLYHEIVHGILYYKQMDDKLHHTEILKNYINELAGLSISLFPNLPLRDARAIAMFGLADIKNTAAYNDVAADLELTPGEISEIGVSYRRDNVAGNVKMGQPCNN